MATSTAAPSSFITPSQRALAATRPVNENPAMPVSRPASVANPSSSQMDFLQQLAGVSLAYGAPVAPGQLTAQQDAVLKAWTENANSGYSQYMLDQGLSTVSQNPAALATLTSSAAAAQWSKADVSESMKALGLSGQEWDQYEKLYDQQQAEEAKALGGFMAIAGVIIGGALAIPTGGLSLAAIPAIAGGAALGGTIGTAAGDVAAS